MATIRKMNRKDYRDHLIDRWNWFWDHSPSWFVFAIFIWFLILALGGCGGVSPIDDGISHG